MCRRESCKVNKDSEMKEPLVSICCITYNHAPYIRQCLEGFLIQKTTFPFEILIHDDASTDGTADIIREYEARYPHLIKPIYQVENQYSKGIEILSTYNYSRAKGKYIALCEGDDYWTDPLKLQKQVHIMETHPTLALCTHNFNVLENFDGKEKFVDRTGYMKDFFYGLKKYFRYWPTQPLTALFRKDCLPCQNEVQEYSYYRDNHLFYYILKKGKGFYISDKMGVYRKHSNGIYAQLSLLKKITIDLDCYIELYIKNKGDFFLWKTCVNYYALLMWHKRGTDNDENYSLEIRKQIGLIGTGLAYLRIGYLFLKKSL